jgi:tyrosine-protein kinase Etk/Wzc
MTPAQHHDPAGEQREMSVYDLLNALLLHRRVVILLPLLFFALTASYSLSQPRTWTSDASFTPQSASGGGSWTGIAAQMGVNIGGADAGESPAFYAELIRSRAILEAALDSSYTQLTGGRETRASLRDILGRGVANADALDLLRTAIAVRTERETGIIRLSVTTEDPQLSREIAATLLALVNEFNLDKRQHQAAAERRFVESRLAEARVELADAEVALQRFEEFNRRIESPHLVLTRGRLQHEVVLRQQLVTSLAEAFERARIDEVRNLPLITIIDRPALPRRSNGRGTVIRSLIAIVLGFSIAAAYAVMRTAFETQATARPDAELFRRLRHEAVDGAAQPFRRIAGVFRPGASVVAGNGSSSGGPTADRPPHEP